MGGGAEPTRAYVAATRYGAVMPVRLEYVGIAGRDPEATVALLTGLGLGVLGRDGVLREWAHTAVGPTGRSQRR